MLVTQVSWSQLLQLRIIGAIMTVQEFEEFLKANPRFTVEYSNGKFNLRLRATNGVRWVRGSGTTIEKMIADYQNLDSLQ